MYTAFCTRSVSSKSSLQYGPASNGTVLRSLSLYNDREHLAGIPRAPEQAQNPGKWALSTLLSIVQDFEQSSPNVAAGQSGFEAVGKGQTDRAVFYAETTLLTD